MLAAIATLCAWSNAPADLIEDTIETSSTVASDAVTCQALPADTPLDNELGSAGFMKNIAEHPESIRVIAQRLLNRAVESEAFRREPACAHECTSDPVPQIVYKVEPTVFLPEDAQQRMCLTLESQTAKHPMRFTEREFDSLEQLNEWIMEFSQGRGDDGKMLYEQCGGNCSPRYTFYITQTGARMSITADVLCGLARDKKSDQYLVSTAVRWRCGN